jgi:hypothetical protein
MRTRSILMVVLVASIAAGCGDSGKKTSGTTTPTTAVTTTVPSTAQLQAMLLTADDINATNKGWTVKPLNKEGLAVTCAEGLDPATAARLTAKVGIDAGREDGNASLQERLITGDPQQLDADLKSCLNSPSTSMTLPTGVRALTLPHLGDQQWAFIRTPASPGWPADSKTYFAYVRVGGNAVNLVVSEQPVRANAKLQITDAEFVQLLKTAVGNLSG